MQEKKRPCQKAHPTTVPLSCYLCWLSENVKSYQRKWGLPETGSLEEAPKSLRKISQSQSQVQQVNRPILDNDDSMRYNLPCTHEGIVLEWCHTCNGERRHVRECDIYDKCTRGVVSNKVKSCVLCSLEKDSKYVPVESKSIQIKTNHINTTTIEKEPVTELGNPMQLGHRRLLLKKNREEEVRRQEAEQQAITTGRQSSKILAVSKLKPNELKWVCAITTVPKRRTTTLIDTIISLSNAGFDKPHLFVDIQDNQYLPELIREYLVDFGLPVIMRQDNIKTFGNWFLALMEMYIRYPLVDRYAFFQDDIIACKNLCEYLEHCEYPTKGYLNLITYPQNETEKLKHFDKSIPEENMIGWYQSNQMGKGAQGLVFDRNTVLEILSNEHLLKRPQEHNGHQNIDGGLCQALNLKGYKEYVHSPSLIRHIGKETSIKTLDDKGHNTHPLEQPQDLSFKGQQWNALDLIEGLP